MKKIVWIISHKREAILKKTLAWLDKTNVRDWADLIKISVHESEMKNYRENCRPPDGMELVPCAEKGCLANHYNVKQYANPGDQVFDLDDDVVLHEVLNEKETRPVVDLKGLLAKGFGLIKGRGPIKGGGLFGIYPVQNPYFAIRSKEITNDLRYVCGNACGYIYESESKNAPHYRFNLAKEDYEMTLRFFVKYGAVYRLNHYIPETKYYLEKGGLSVEHGGNEQRYKNEKIGCMYLREKFGPLVPSVLKKGKTYQIKLDFRKKLTKQEKKMLMLENGIA